MARPKSTNSRSSIAEQLTRDLGFNVTPRQVQLWQGKGYNLDDLEELKRSLRNQERVPAGLDSNEEGETIMVIPEGELTEEWIESTLKNLAFQLGNAQGYDESRKLSTQVTGISNLLKALREQGRYILKDDSAKQGAQCGIAVKAEIEKIEDELPPQLEGLTALQMKVKLRDYARLMLMNIESTFEPE